MLLTLERLLRLGLLALCVSRLFSSTATAEVSLPLSTQGRYIVDARGERVRLASVNWYGSHLATHTPGGLDQQNIDHIISLIKKWGFNSVRLPFSNEMLRDQNVIPIQRIAANPQFYGKTPLEVFDATVAALSRAGLFVILNNHNTYSGWCCGFDTNGLWYNGAKGVPFPLSLDEWQNDWLSLVSRYRHNPWVVGVDLRNEVRTQKIGNTILPSSPNWGQRNTNDWHLAAETLGRRILDANPSLLIVVEGINWTGAIPILGSGERPHLRPVRELPIRLQRPDKLVYGVHHYGYIGPRHNGDAKTSGNNPTYCEMDELTYQRTLEEEWLFVLEDKKFSTAPVWISEFGAGHAEPSPCERRWFERFLELLTDRSVDFAYWPLNPDSFGLVRDDWSDIRDNDWRTPTLKRLLEAPVEAADPSPFYRQLSIKTSNDDQSSRQEDWLPGAHKGTCPDGTRLLGLSRDFRGLCGNPWPNPALFPVPGSVVVAVNESNERPHTQGDWASGFTKYECPIGTYVAGFSKHHWGVSGVLCLKTEQKAASSCQTLWFDKGDQRMSPSGGDWALAAYKGQCRDEDYVAGIAQRDGSAAALLCCSSSP